MSILLGDNFSYSGAKPLDARLTYATLASMVAAADSTLYSGIIAYCVETDKNYQWKSTNTADSTLGKWREFETGGGGDAVVYTPGGSYTFATKPAASASTLGFVYDITDDFTTTADFKEGAGIDYPAGTDIAVVNVGTVENPVYKYNVLMGSLANYQKKMQFAVMPTANNSHVGWIVQYMGATVAGSYTHGYFYECVTDGTTYSWEASPTQESEGSAEGKAESSAIAPVFDATATYAAGDRVMYEDELYVFNTAHTGAWDAADADKSDVDSEIPDKLTSQQMQDIKDVFVVDSPRNGYPVLFDETGAEHFVGWYKYANGTKKPVYEKTVSGTTGNCTTQGIGVDTNIPVGASVELFVYMIGFIELNGAMQNINSSFMYGVAGLGWCSCSGITNNFSEEPRNIVKVRNAMPQWNGKTAYVTVQYTKTTDTPQ